MAAQESSKVCPKCFEVNDHGATFCIECGAPFSDDPEDEDSDKEVYREITQANLHRIRGDYKSSVNACLSILKRFPNNGTAHTLLGDIHAEQGELEQSAQWFEMALDLRPESENDRRKLDEVQKRMSQQETASSAKQLGIPESKPQTQQYVFVMAILIAIVGVAGFMFGNAMGAKNVSDTPQVIEDPIDIAPRTQTTEPITTEEPTPSNTSNAKAFNSEDASLAALLNASEAVGLDVLSVVTDPRKAQVTVIAKHNPQDTSSYAACFLAQAIFDEHLEIEKVTMQLTNGQSIVYMADVLREDFFIWENAEDVAQIVSGVWPLVIDD